VSRADDLLARVLAEPGDHELRKVLADALVEEGHPRGELIHLQYARLEGRGTPEMAEREKLLLERHGPDLLGPLVGAVGSYEIERGFLRKCDVPWHRQSYNIERAVDHPLWSTVEELHGPAAIYLAPAMRSLVSLITPHELGKPAIDVLCGGSIERGLVKLAVTNTLLRDIPIELFDSPALPHLRELHLPSIRSPADLERLQGTPITRRLERLTINGRCDLREMHEAIVRVRPAATVALVDLEGGGWYSRLELFGDYDRARLVARFARGLYGPPFSLRPLRGRLQRVDLIIVPGESAFPQRLMQELQEQVAAFPESSCVVEQ
jgi:uncharacterized protein (TIGR02996 family)